MIKQRMKKQNVASLERMIQDVELFKQNNIRLQLAIQFQRNFSIRSSDYAKAGFFQEILNYAAVIRIAVGNENEWLFCYVRTLTHTAAASVLSVRASTTFADRNSQARIEKAKSIFLCSDMALADSCSLA